jgi:hypothetical protein
MSEQEAQPDTWLQLIADLAQTVHNLESGGVFADYSLAGHAGLDWRLCPSKLCGLIRARSVILLEADARDDTPPAGGCND